MKIGILTFHWATNYGAVLQCYALQSYLESMGHDVKVINYKPRQYDDNLYTFLRFRKFLNIKDYLNNRKKEVVLAKFRDIHFSQTERVYSYKNMASIASRFDIIVSGSDQVVNPSFLMHGEGHGIVSPTYFLGFPFKGKRVGYALSFGCVTYPGKANKVASKFIKNFDVISVRENTGIDIVKSMGRDDVIVVPDPTLLMKPCFYHSLADECPLIPKESYIYSFFIRHIADRMSVINTALDKKNIIWNNEEGDYTIQAWLSYIKYAEFVVTDSFHCVVMCLKLHKPFAVITEQKGNIGMNDRLYTLLSKTGLYNRILYKNDIHSIKNLCNDMIDWGTVDACVNEQRIKADKIFDL